jgi:protein deglycase
MPTIIVPIAAGFEEIEACTIIDVLRRAEFNVITAGMESKCVCGSHDIIIECDHLFENIDFTDVDGLVLPGGMPGSGNLLASQKLRKIITELNQREKCIAAICAAPWVLAEAGVLNDKNATSYPDFAEKLAKSNYSNRRVVSDGNLITSRGVGTALEFSLTLVEYFKGFDVTKELAEKMLVNWPSDKH